MRLISQGFGILGLGFRVLGFRVSGPIMQTIRMIWGMLYCITMPGKLPGVSLTINQARVFTQALKANTVTAEPLNLYSIDLSLRLSVTLSVELLL